MTQEKLSELKEEYLTHINNMVETAGGVFPHITIFADNNENEPSIVHIPIPEEFMKDDETKENFIETILPKIAENVKEDFTPHAVAWSSECWMRQADKDKPIENWKKQIGRAHV